MHHLKQCFLHSSVQVLTQEIWESLRSHVSNIPLGLLLLLLQAQGPH